MAGWNEPVSMNPASQYLVSSEGKEKIRALEKYGWAIKIVAAIAAIATVLTVIVVLALAGSAGSSEMVYVAATQEQVPFGVALNFPKLFTLDIPVLGKHDDPCLPGYTAPADGNPRCTQYEGAANFSAAPPMLGCATGQYACQVASDEWVVGSCADPCTRPPARATFSGLTVAQLQAGFAQSRYVGPVNMTLYSLGRLDLTSVVSNLTLTAVGGTALSEPVPLFSLTPRTFAAHATDPMTFALTGTVEEILLTTVEFIIP